MGFEGDEIGLGSAAVSIWRQPARSAYSTAAVVTSGGVWNTPRPMLGMAIALFRLMAVFGMTPR